MLATTAVRRVMGALAGGVCVANLDTVVAVNARTVALANILNRLSGDQGGRVLRLAILVHHAWGVTRLLGKLAHVELVDGGLLTDWLYGRPGGTWRSRS